MRLNTSHAIPPFRGSFFFVARFCGLAAAAAAAFHFHFFSFFFRAFLYYNLRRVIICAALPVPCFLVIYDGALPRTTASTLLATGGLKNKQQFAWYPVHMNLGWWLGLKYRSVEYQVQGGLRRGGLTPTCGSAHGACPPWP